MPATASQPRGPELCLYLHALLPARASACQVEDMGEKGKRFAARHYSGVSLFSSVSALRDLLHVRFASPQLGIGWERWNVGLLEDTLVPTGAAQADHGFKDV